MKRVLYVSGSAFGGADKSLLDLIKSVCDKVEPIVLFTKDGEAYKAFEKEGVECIVHPFTSVYLPSDYFKRVILHPNRLRTVKHFIYDIPCRRYVKKVLGERGVDIVHSNYTLTSIGVQLAATLNVPHVWHIREYLDTPHFTAKIYKGRGWLRKQINSADSRIFISKSCCEHWHLKANNSYTILDAVMSTNDCCYNKEKQAYVLFCSSIISEAKGALIAVNAFGKSGLSEHGLRLKMVGYTSEEMARQIKNAAVKYGCANSVDMIVLQENVKPFFANAMAFVNPSMNEGMGRTTAEAMFCGCPVIAHASGGTLDLVKHGETGYLFNTVDECAELMKQVCTTNQEGVILRAQKFAKQNLSIENYGAKIMEVYDTVLKLK